MSGFTPRIGILLATYNGARFLSAQLDSFRTQTEPGWILFWRDDGSSDDTVAQMTAFAAEIGEARCIRVEGAEHLGASASFFALLAAATSHGLPLAFADQDDVWLPDKLAWALEALAPTPGTSLCGPSPCGPSLYCSRQTLVDEALHPIGQSALLHSAPSFANALTQNIATGCTIVLDPAAARLVAGSQPSAAVLHDWWSYLVITAAGGRVVADARPTVLYRQHGSNLVGAPVSNISRARAALRRGPAIYMAVLRANVAALLKQRELLTPEALETLRTIDRGLRGNPVARLRALALPGFRRQTPMETALFRCWFMIG